jgi:hypothetical protein
MRHLYSFSIIPGIVLLLLAARASGNTCSILGPEEVCAGQEHWYELTTDLPGNGIIWHVEGGEVLQQNNFERRGSLCNNCRG